MIQKFSNDELIEQTHSLLQEERRLDLEVLRHLYEIERRKLYLEKSYPSLFEMCVGEFKLSRASAQRRISAMRLLKEIPEVAPKIASGELNVSVMAQTQSFFLAEKKNARTYTKEEKLELVKSFEMKSTREVEKELAARNPAIVQYETVKPVSATQSKITIIITSELQEKMDRLKELKAHANPSMTYEGLFELLVEQELKRELKKIGQIQVRQMKNSSSIGQASTSTDKKSSRTRTQAESKLISDFPAQLTSDNQKSAVPAPELKIAKTVKLQRRPTATLTRKIWRRDQNQCTHQNHQTGERCQAKAFLQIDHIKPYGIGGETTEENLRLLCGAHNRHRIQQTFFYRHEARTK